MTVLSVTDLTTGYDDVPVLNEVDIDIHENETVGVIGPNGAGKSTLFKAIMGYIHPWEGEITFQGEVINDLGPSDIVKSGLGYVPQEENVFPNMTVRENLQMGAFTISDDEFESSLETIFEVFPDLEDRGSQRVHTMSGGERKMVAIARALVTSPSFLILDEPSAGLMPKYITDIYDTIERIHESQGISILFIEQDVQTLLQYTDRVYVLRNGENRLEASSQELRESDDLKQAYLGGRAGAAE
jgi:ABC-type branched-subunit amino acid transport system ATPase component